MDLMCKLGIHKMVVADEQDERIPFWSTLTPFVNYKCCIRCNILEKHELRKNLAGELEYNKQYVNTQVV